MSNLPCDFEAAAGLPELLRGVMLRRARAELTDCRVRDDASGSTVLRLLQAHHAVPAEEMT